MEPIINETATVEITNIHYAQQIVEKKLHCLWETTVDKSLTENNWRMLLENVMMEYSTKNSL